MLWFYCYIIYFYNKYQWVWVLVEGATNGLLYSMKSLNSPSGFLFYKMLFSRINLESWYFYYDLTFLMASRAISVALSMLNLSPGLSFALSKSAWELLGWINKIIPDVLNHLILKALTCCFSILIGLLLESKVFVLDLIWLKGWFRTSYANN